jgi:hypothetical protein
MLFHLPAMTLVAPGRRVTLPRARAAPLSQAASGTLSQLQVLASSLIADASRALDEETFGLGDPASCGKHT